ncbi:MAG: phosphatidate cytidylyltransferase [Oligoflexales bacterium]
MLKTRIWTAVILLPLILSILIAGSALQAGILMGVVVVFVSYELGRMLSLPLVLQTDELCVATCLFSIAGGFGVFALGAIEHGIASFWLLWAVLMAVCCLWPGDVRQKVARMLITTFSGVYCGGGWLAMWHLYMLYPRASGLILMMTVVIVTDSAAYFGGTKWGRRKLAPTLSPGKSWEGFWCGIVASVVGAVLCNFAYGEMFGSMHFIAMLGICGASAGVVGDLIESALKRYAGVKDAGNLLPGHGGFLDRCDAAMFAAPVFVALLQNFS